VAPSDPDSRATDAFSVPVEPPSDLRPSVVPPIRRRFCLPVPATARDRSEQ